MSNRIDSNDESWTEALEPCSVEETQSEDASSGGYPVHQILRELQSLPKDCLFTRIKPDGIHGHFISVHYRSLPSSLHLSELFHKEGEKHFSEKIIQDARLQVLGAIGLLLAHNNVLMVRKDMWLGLNGISKFYSRFDFLELKTLLGPVRSSPVLEELWLCHQVVFNTTESWILVAELIRSVRTLRSLIACDASILVSDLAVVAGAVTATYPSPLTKLELRRNAIFNEAGAKLVVDVLRSAPNLIELGVGPFEDEVGAKQIGEAVASHTAKKKRRELGKFWNSTWRDYLPVQMLPDDIRQALMIVVNCCLKRDYLTAMDQYIKLAIGNAPWPIGVTMVGIHERSAREKIYTNSVAHIMNDETTRKYLQSIKRLMTLCQRRYPSAPSKSVEFNSFANGSDLQSLLSEERAKTGSHVAEERLRLMAVPAEVSI